MIDFKLSEELKRAGFPQDTSPFVFYICKTGDNSPHTLLRIRNTLTGYNENEVLGYVAAPILEELVEACAQKKLTVANVYKNIPLNFWTASNNKIRVKGSTPDEAVAKLWLALNKKDTHL